MSEPIDVVGEQLRVGDRVGFQPPSGFVVGRVTTIDTPSALAPRSADGTVYGRMRITIEVDQLYAVQNHHTHPMTGVFKMAAPEIRSEVVANS